MTQIFFLDVSFLPPVCRNTKKHMQMFVNVTCVRYTLLLRLHVSDVSCCRCVSPELASGSDAKHQVEFFISTTVLVLNVCVSLWKEVVM